MKKIFQLRREFIWIAAVLLAFAACIYLFIRPAVVLCLRYPVDVPSTEPQKFLDLPIILSSVTWPVRGEGIDISRNDQIVGRLFYENNDTRKLALKLSTGQVVPAWNMDLKSIAAEVRFDDQTNELYIYHRHAEFFDKEELAVISLSTAKRKDWTLYCGNLYDKP